MNIDSVHDSTDPQASPAENKPGREDDDDDPSTELTFIALRSSSSGGSFGAGR